MSIIRKNGFIFMVFATCMCASKFSHAGALDTVDTYKKARYPDKAMSVLEKKHNTLNYLPYIEVGGSRFSIGQAKASYGTDLFIPLWQNKNQLVFSDLRFYDRTGTPFEGNAHIGYRHLSPEKEYMLGVYGSFDRKRSELGNYFNQITVGGEYWLKTLFLGANFYQPIGDATKASNVAQTAELDRIYRNVWVTTNKQSEKAMQGGDAEIGYEFMRGLAWYVGGYYFNASETDTIYGPKLRITYDWSLENGKRILGIFDKFGLEGGVQHDKPRGTLWYASAKVRIGLMPNREANLEGVARHMVDLVRRDVDVVSSVSKTQKREPYTEDGKVVLFVKSNDGKESVKDVGHNRIRRLVKNEHVIVTNLGNVIKLDVSPVFEVEDSAAPRSTPTPTPMPAPKARQQDDANDFQNEEDVVDLDNNNDVGEPVVTPKSVLSREELRDLTDDL